MNTRSKNTGILNNLSCQRIQSQMDSEICSMTNKISTNSSMQPKHKNNNNNSNNCSEKEQAETLTTRHNNFTEVSTQRYINVQI